MRAVIENALSESNVEVLIIGAGLGGIGMAVELRRREMHDFVVIDQGPRVGGVWRDNQYPNAATDTPIELYAFADFPGMKWSTNFAPWHEILEYLNDIVAENGLRPHLRMDTRVESLSWDAERARWHVRAAGRRGWNARFVVWAGGLLSQPLIPDIPGLDEFGGTIVHTARWSDDLDLTGRHVLVVGGGATSIQVVPYAADHAARVYALVRTPSYVLPKPEKFYDDADRSGFRTGGPAQARERARWLDHFEKLTRTRFPMNEELIAQQEDAWRESFDTLVTSPRLREILTPDYGFGCRRPLVSNTYYQAFQKPTVTAIGGSIERILPDGVVTTEADQINVDTIIFATGFDAQSMLGSLRIDNGRGQRLEEAWKDRPRAYLCTLVKDFPNLFLINGPNAGGPAVTDVITAQAAYIARGNCSSWYRTGGGDGQVFTHWPGTITSLREALAQAPDSHLIITAPAGPAT